MKRVLLRNTSVESSVLGFGCSSLTMHDDRAKAVRILETAFDQGITHFDVARLYGFGQAEGILGEFLQGKRDRVTVTTKFGLKPNAALAKHRRLIGIARRVVHQFGFLRRFVRRRSAQLMTAGAFDPTEAADSLQTSLRELRTDHVDLFLLHECTTADARREDLLAFLDSQVAAGTIRHYGLGTVFGNLGEDAGSIPPGHRVLQFDNNVVSQNLKRLKNAGTRGIITHSAINLAPRLASAATTNPTMARRYADATGADLSNPAAVAALLLEYAVNANPEGIVLFATTRTQHVTANVASLARGGDPAARLAALADFATTAVLAGTGGATADPPARGAAE